MPGTIYIEGKMKPELCAAVDKFCQLQQKLNKWGASDSEPNWMFNSLMRKAIKGLPWTEPQPEAWQLFTSVAGHKKAALRLTAEANRVYNKLQKASVLDVKAVAEWYGW